MIGKTISMKQLLLTICLLFILQSTYGQEKKIKPFFEGSFKPTFAINEDYTIDPDGDINILRLTGTFFRFGFGYQFGRRVLVSLHAGYDYHFPDAIHAFPTYARFRFNVWNREDENLFLQYSQGKMWRPSNRFSDGDYYNFGFGYELESDSRWKPVIQITYHRKSLTGFENLNNLESVSLGIGFRFY